jgi:putative peptide zinc metalloprotease protein
MSSRKLFHLLVTSSFLLYTIGMASAVNDFWMAVEQATDPTAYKPRRNGRVIVTRLAAREEPYYILKEPSSQSYLRLSEADYALWWQMDGRKSVKDLLFYCLIRYRSLPIGHLNSLVADLQAGHFLQDQPANIYGQIERQLEARAPTSRGHRILNAFLHTELSVDGLDAIFTHLYRWTRPLFLLPVQLILLFLVVLGGGLLFARLFWLQTFALTGSGGLSLIGLLVANLLVIGVHELSHGLTTKHIGRELNRGGFLIYWGMPAFFVDTRDIWRSPRRHRVAVSWAGPHSGLLIGGVIGGALTAITVFYPEYIHTLGVGFLYQVGFLAYLSVFINLNPLLELDGYFILMDWLDIPGLRQRALRFWRVELWGKWRGNKNPRQFWDSLIRNERIFSLYGGLTLAYSSYALVFALYFWQTRLQPLVGMLWNEYGLFGRLIVLLVATVIVLPGAYFTFIYAGSRIRSGLEWLTRRDLLARPAVLATLLGLSLVIGLPLLFLFLSSLPNSDLWLNLTVWLMHVVTIGVLATIARQVPGSRFQWALWSLTGVPAGLTITWIAVTPIWQDLGLIIASICVLASGIVSWFTVWPMALERSDRLLMSAVLLLGLIYAAGLYFLQNGLAAATALTLLVAAAALVLMAPLLLNFWHSRFALPWSLMTLAILATPALRLNPSLHLPLTSLWLYAGLLYLLLGALAQFSRQAIADEGAADHGERERLSNSFNHFMQAMFDSYEAVIGGRRLVAIQTQIIALGPVDPDASILQIADRCRTALLLAIDRLDDLAGTPFTQQAGKAAYDSLPWLEAETLARHVLSTIEWGGHLAEGFIEAQSTRVALIRQADIFAGFDQQAVQDVSGIAYSIHSKPATLIASAGHDATRFFLIETGEVGVFHEGVQMAVLRAGGYFGTNALLEDGNYQFTYRALTSLRLLPIDRDRFDPLLRANTTLSDRISSGAETRKLLKKMALFRSLSPQQLAVIDARLQHRHVVAGEIVVGQGQPRSHLFIIAAGQIEVLREDGTGEMISGNLGSGEHFGEYALFTDTPYSATYRAFVDSKLLALDEPSFDQLVAESQLMSRYVEQIGSGRSITSRHRRGPGSNVP